MAKVMEQLEGPTLTRDNKERFKYEHFDYQYKTLKGYAGNQLSGGYKFPTGGGFYFSDSGGPNVSGSVSLSLPAPYNFVLSKVQQVTPSFIDQLIGLYERKNTSQKDRRYILLELKKYYSDISLSKYDLISCAKEWRANKKSFQSALDYIYLSKDIIIKQDVLIS